MGMESPKAHREGFIRSMAGLRYSEPPPSSVKTQYSFITRKNPRAKPYLKKEFPLYEKIAELVDGAHTGGNNAPLEPSQIRALTPVSPAPSIDRSIQKEMPENAELMSESDDESDAEVCSPSFKNPRKLFNRVSSQTLPALQTKTRRRMTIPLAV